MTEKVEKAQKIERIDMTPSLDLSVNPNLFKGIKTIFFPSIVVWVLFSLLHHFQPKDILPSDTKPYDSFDSFYPFYLTQHRDPVCQFLHILGTSIVLMIGLTDPSVLYALLNVIILGYAIFPYTRGLSHGFYDMVILSLIYQVSVRICKGSTIAKIAPLIAYGFAWIGHYGFENNKPATFIYPVFSLLGDFKMMFELIKSHY